jgi:lipoprotein NlpD
MEGPVAARTVQIALTLALTALLLAGCGRPPPLYAPRYYGPPPPHYQVRPGDTLYSIGQRFGLDHRKIARWNGIDDPGELTLGQRLRLRPPEGGGASSGERARSGSGDAGASGGGQRRVEAKGDPRAGKVAVAGGGEASTGGGGPADGGDPPGRWRWPVNGEVVRGFSKGGEDRSNGIDIAAPAGSEVRAAAAGKVVYSGNGLRGYGNLVIIRHSGNYLTTYGYNRENLVAEDDRVETGQVVARVGETGAAERPSLHFEVRRRTEPIDPMRLLPDR